jgi:pyruvate dehydrogenase (quinone)/pyruvate oxidase
MAMTGGDILIETLMDWGVDVVFGLPGDGVDGVMEALRIRRDKVRFIHVRHEESAAFMACAYAKYTGRLGVCLGTSGPGGIHLLNGLYDAKLDQQPVVAITGMQYHDSIETHTQQDVELDKLFMDVAKYNGRVMGPHHVENVAELACRTALAYRGVAHVTIPVDFQSRAANGRGPSKRNVSRDVPDVWVRSARLPDPEGLKAAAEILNSGRKIAILAGQGALHAADELEETAEMLGAPIVKALLGKAAVPDDSPYTTGQVGLLGTRPSQDALADCDTLLIVGSTFPYIEFYPKPPGKARGIQIDLDPQRIGLRYPVEVGLIGDSRETLRRLLPMVRRNRHRAFLERAQEGMKDWRSLMEMRGTRTDVPMKPEVVAYQLGRRIARNAIVSCDSGTIATWWARQVPARRGQMHSISGALATMACGLPYAIGAQVAYPDRQSVAIVGDGGFSMLMADFSTCVKYNLPVKVIIFKNNLLGQTRGYTVEDPEYCGAVLDEALNTPGPAIVEAVVDPHEPPLPAKITVEQAMKMAESLAAGTPYRGRIALTVTQDKIKEMV